MSYHICMIAYTTYSTDARVRREAEALAELPDHTVSVLALKEHRVRRTYLLDQVTVEELGVAKYRGRNILWYLLSYLAFLALAFARCSWMCMTRSADAVHVHNMPNFLVFAAIIPRLLGKQVVLDIHDTMPETYASKFSGSSGVLLRRLFEMEESISCKLAKRIVSVNDIQREALVNRGIPESKLLVLMNLPDPKKFCATPRVDGGAGRGGLKLVYFGTLTTRLGVDLALRAIAAIRHETPGLQFFVFGGGEDRPQLVRLSGQLGLDETTRFSDGPVPLDALVDIVRGMDLTVVPNRRNAATDLMLPVKMLESIALGVPVVAPRLKTIEHYFDSEQLFFFEPDDVASLAGAIRRACADRRERERKVQNARRFLQTHAWETQKRALIGLYRSGRTKARLGELEGGI